MFLAVESRRRFGKQEEIDFEGEASLTIRSKHLSISLISPRDTLARGLPGGNNNTNLTVLPVAYIHIVNQDILYLRLFQKHRRLHGVKSSGFRDVLLTAKITAQTRSEDEGSFGQ